MTKKAFILDLDDTLFIAKPILEELNRRNFSSQEEFWRAFHDVVDQEKLDDNCYSLVKLFISLGWRPIISTARSEEIYRKTFACIKRFAPVLAQANPIILMRAYNDTSPSQEVKAELLRHIICNLGFDVQVALDDDINNVKMFKKYGTPVIRWCTISEDED